MNRRRRASSEQIAQWPIAAWTCPLRIESVGRLPLRRLAVGKAGPARQHRAAGKPANRQTGRLRGVGARRPSALTLVELLVVLAVLAVLAALWLPALARSRASALRAQCTGHLRQLGMAAQMYWDDHRGECFRYRGAATNGGDVYWFGWLARGAEGHRAFDLTQGALYPYLAGRGIEICPALHYAMARFKRKARGAAFGYGYNLLLSAPLNEPPVNVAALAHPATTVLLADAAQVNTFQPPASPANPLLEEFYYVNTNEPTVHFRHHAAANAVFCDGHVASERPAAGTLDARLPGETIGRLRTEILVPW
jgi:prepilin-type N-terminal cleavage/methylation domain-containing protein/prepilin-type processing-associated H-X9-DG protein